MELKTNWSNQGFRNQNFDFVNQEDIKSDKQACLISFACIIIFIRTTENKNNLTKIIEQTLHYREGLFLFSIFIYIIFINILKLNLDLKKYLIWSSCSKISFDMKYLL
jgi:hypothetical protein